MKIEIISFTILPAPLTTKSTEGFRVAPFLKWIFCYVLVCFLQGVLHSSSLPDYIEDKKSGGQQTDCLVKCLCNDSTIITGLADSKRADAKNRNDIVANRYF
jgi:hypothetical protein